MSRDTILLWIAAACFAGWFLCAVLGCRAMIRGHQKTPVHTPLGLRQREFGEGMDRADRELKRRGE